jgi:PAS domain S-box-containing protein
MIILDLINNLALLTALTVLSGFIGERCRQRLWNQLLQGLLFGGVAVIGMLRPLVLGPGLIFDGRSVMISLCGLFFGPLSVVIAGAITIAGRVWLGGVGQTMGVLVILASGALGLAFHHRLAGKDEDVSSRLLLCVGLLVHASMILLMFTLPYEVCCVTMSTLFLPVIIGYPLATVLIGKVLADQRARVRFTAALQSNREELRTTLYSIGDGVVTADGEGRLRQLNPEAEKLLGWTEAEACGKHYGEVFRLVGEKTRDVVENPIERVLREGRIIGLANHTLLLARDGREIPIADSGAPIRNKEGELTGVVLVFRDQSAERAAQRTLQVERDNLRAIMKASPVAIIVLDESECVKDANPAAERLFGRRLSELSDRSCGAFLGCCNPSPDAACGHTANCPSCTLRNTLHEVLATGQCVYDREMEYVCLGQGAERRRWLLFSMVEVALDGSRYLLAALSDLTRYRQTEEALKRIEWMLSKKPPKPEAERALASGAAGGEDGECSSSGGRIGTSVGREMLANIVSEYLDLLGTAFAIHEADGSCVFKRSESGWCRLLDRGMCVRRETAARAQDVAAGSLLCGQLAWEACSKEAMASRAPAELGCLCGMRLYAVPILMRGDVIGAICFIYGDPTRDPARIRLLADEYRLDYDELLREAYAYDARPPYIIEMAKGRLQTSAWLIGSLAEARQAEAEHAKLEAQFRHSQKMEAIGRLAGGVAHDFNNILQGIIGYGELLVERLPEADESQEFAREIVVEGKRAATLTRQLLAFARKQASDPKVLDLNEAVVATLKMLRRLLGEDIELRWVPATERCLVKVDPSQLEQILANLAVNSRDAIDGVGRITLETQTVTLDEAESALIPGCRPGRYVLLLFSDDGCGMDQTVMEHLFEPFFTTKVRGRGTGLGLATVYGIVDQSGGLISVTSEPGKGTAFKIYLPEQAADHVEAVAMPLGDLQPTGTETVLIVDDEETLLRSARRILEGLGYTVLAAGSPEEAIRVAQSYHQEIHVLLTDVVMPGMSGRDLWLRLEALRPRMKCVFMSGYTANIIAQRGTLNAGVRFLQKPFTKAALAHKLREALTSSIG